MIKKRPERAEKFKTISGLPVRALYSPEDTRGVDYLRDLGFPGEPPFTRGVQPNMYRGQFWTMRQYAGFATAAESNKRYRYLLEQGTTGLSVAFDLPTQMGYDSTDPEAAGEVGKTGVAIDSLADMETLFDGIPLDGVTTSMTINSTASILLALYIAVAEKQGVAADKIRGTIQNDLLKEYIARGTYIYPPKHSMRIITDIFAYCKDHVPNWNTISISGYHIREAGSTAPQELAFTLADAIAYVQAAVDTGLDVDEFAGRLSFFWNVHNHFLEEVAKFRAGRRMWYKILKERFGAKNPKVMKLRFHTQTAGSTLTAQQPENNIVRVTIQALAAVLGGTQSLHTNSMDEALALPTEKSVQIALRTQQVIAHESGVADFVDPLAGSYVIESLTNELEAEAFALIEQIDKLGGMVEAIDEGWPQRQIQEAAYRRQLEIEAATDVVVGMNKFKIEHEAPIPILKVDPAIEKTQRENLARVKDQRDAKRVEASLTALEKAARDGANLMPPILECVRGYTTLGEIAHRLRKVFGIYQPPMTI
ncbi:MAG: methylmalonyl-CoA mutase family protein [Myxococcales bacterium]|nr:methylmalonyl-CoA mutase family protein [Myxococcales bacterium]